MCFIQQYMHSILARYLLSTLYEFKTIGQVVTEELFDLHKM